MSISGVEAYLRSAEFVERPSAVKRLIYMHLPHPCSTREARPVSGAVNTDYINKDL